MEKSKKIYIVRTKFEFTGEFKVNAESAADARRIVEKSCGATLGTVQSIDPAVLDWEFPQHPEKQVGYGKIEH